MKTRYPDDEVAGGTSEEFVPGIDEFVPGVDEHYEPDSEDPAGRADLGDDDSTTISMTASWTRSSSPTARSSRSSGGPTSASRPWSTGSWAAAWPWWRTPPA